MAVTHVATGAKSAGGTTTVTIASPASTASGQMLLAFRAGWIPSTTWTDETDWTASGQTTTGGTGSSVDAHTTAIRCDRRVLTGSLAGPTTFDQTHTSNAGTIGIMLSYQHGGGGFDTVATATGDDTSHGTNRSITSTSNIDLAVDDVVVVAVATDTDTNLADFANQAITASGITFGSTTRRSPSTAGVTTGGDGNIEVFEATVTSGSGTVAVTLAFDTSTSQCGPGVFVRLREVGGVDIATDPLRIDVEMGTTSLTLGETNIATDPLRIDVEMADTTVTPGETTITTDPLTVDVEMGVTFVEASVITDPMVIDVEMAATTVETGATEITTDPLSIDVEMGVTSVEQEDPVAITTDPLVIDVEMGTTFACVGEVVEILTASGTWDWEAAGEPSEVEVWVIAGGGAGGPAGSSVAAGGGGAGGVVHDASYPVSGDIAYTIGNAGAGGSPTGPVDSTDGGDSVWDTGGTPLTADGGGAGGGLATRPNGNNGGSGGGGRGVTAPAGTGGSGTGGQGNNGGTGFASGTVGQRAGGGGGGQSAVGANGANSVGGNGGNGIDLSAVVGTGIGDSGWFAGGGGGGFVQAGDTPGSGGQGGGGDGAGNGNPGQNATAYGGGGGGAGDTADGGDGFQGAIILRYNPCEGTTPAEIITDPLVIDVEMAATTVATGETTITTDPLVVDVELAATTVATGETTIVTDPLVIDVAMADTTVQAPVAITTDPLVIDVEMGVTSVEQDEPVAVATSPLVISVELGTTFVTLGSDAATFNPVSYWLEVWRRPGAANFGKVLDTPPTVVASYHVGIGLTGDGQMTLPDTFEYFDDILDVANEVGSLVRIREDDTGSIVGEWVPNAITPVADKDSPFVDVSGSSMNEVPGYAVAEAYDWDGSVEWACAACDWIWGGRQLLGNPGFEDSSPVLTVYTLTIDATGGSFTLTDGTDTTSSFSFPFDDLAASLQTEIEADIAALPDVVVDRTSIANPAYSIQFYDPPFGPTLSVNTGSLTGGSATIAVETEGYLNVSPWTLEYNFADSDPGIPDNWVFQAATSPVRTGTYSLEVNAPPATPISNRNPGIQQIVSVTPGMIYQASVWVWPTSATDRFRLYLATPGEEVIATSGSTGTTLTPGQWNQIVLSDVVIPAGVTTLAFRLDQPNPYPYNYATYFVDDASFYEGFVPTTVGEIIRVLYEDATVDHVADGRLVWEDEANPGNPWLLLDFDDVNDSSGTPWANPDVSIRVFMRMTYLQMLEALESQEAIEWRVVPQDPLTGTSGIWLLQVYDDGNMDDLPAVAIHGGSQDTRRELRRFRPMTAWLVEGGERMSARASSVSGFGRIETARQDRTAPDMVSTAKSALQDKANADAINDIWSYELTEPQDAPLYQYRIGDTIGVHDPPDVDDSGRVWELNMTLEPDGVTWDIDILKPEVEVES